MRHQSMPFGFLIQEFLICLFNWLKMGFVCEFQHAPLCKMKFFSRFHMSCGYENLWACTQLTWEQKFWSPLIHIYSKNGFLATKILLHPSCTWKEKLFLKTLNIMILQMVRNECVRFGGHVDIYLSYKTLWLEVPKASPILHNLPCFMRDRFEEV
jgi:hypothetical protein